MQLKTKKPQNGHKWFDLAITLCNLQEEEWNDYLRMMCDVPYAVVIVVIAYFTQILFAVNDM